MDLTDILKNIDILQLFKDDPFSNLTASDIEKKLGLSHHPTFRKLKLLESGNVLLKTDGRYSLNMQNKLVFEIMKFLSNVERIKKNDR